jgi:hypothetical protein
MYFTKNLPPAPMATNEDAPLPSGVGRVVLLGVLVMGPSARGVYDGVACGRGCTINGIQRAPDRCYLPMPHGGLPHADAGRLDRPFMEVRHLNKAFKSCPFFGPYFFCNIFLTPLVVGIIFVMYQHFASKTRPCR